MAKAQAMFGVGDVVVTIAAVANVAGIAGVDIVTMADVGIVTMADANCGYGGTVGQGQMTCGMQTLHTGAP